MSDKFAEAIGAELEHIFKVLNEKNKSYGNNALEPVNILSRLDAVEGLKVRIDDKLGRLKNQPDAFNEDTVLDLIGYLILLRVAQKESGAPRTGAVDRQ